MEAVDVRPDVGRVGLSHKDSPSAPGPLAAEGFDIAGERRRHRLDETAVVKEAEVAGGAEQELAALPARVSELPPEVVAEDRLVEAAEAVAAHDLSGVDRFRHRELFVRVAAAVAPGEEPVLDQQAPLRVEHALLRHDERRGARQGVPPEVDESVARALVGRVVQQKVLGVHGLDEPAD